MKKGLTLIENLVAMGLAFFILAVSPLGRAIALEFTRDKNVATFIQAPIINATDNISYATGANNTKFYISTQDAEGAFGAWAVANTNVTIIGTSGVYNFPLNATEMNHQRVGIMYNGTGCLQQSFTVNTDVKEVVDAIQVKTDFLPSATAGTAGGVFIAGTNAPVTITGSGTALTLTSTAANGNGISATGNGTGRGMLLTGGASGAGLYALGGGTANGAGIYAKSQSSDFYGIHCEGAGASESGGFKGFSVTSGEGIEGVGAGNGHGLQAVGSGTGEGLHATGGTGNTGDGAIFEAGTGATNGAGLRLIGVGTGLSHGLVLTRGATAGDDLFLTNSDAPTLGTAVWATTARTITGGNLSNPQTFNLTGNITGSLSGSVASVTGNVSAVTGAVGSVAGNVTGSVGSLSATAVQSIWDALTSALSSVGSIGKLLIDNLNAAITTRMATFTLPGNFSATNITTDGRVYLAPVQAYNVTGNVLGNVTNVTNGVAATVNASSIWDVDISSGYTSHAGEVVRRIDKNVKMIQ